MSSQWKTSPALAGLTALAFGIGALAAAATAEQPPQTQAVRSPAAPPPPAPRPVPTQQPATDVPAEIPDAQRAAVKAKPDALDLNNDGRIDLTEANGNSILAPQFHVLDVDADGKLSLREFATASDLAQIEASNGKPRRH